MKASLISVLIVTMVSSVGTALAWCPDQWTRDAANPVLSDGIPATVLFHEGIYKIWYDRIDGFGYATSSDGRVWQKHPASPVLVPGPEWYDTQEAASASVVIVDGTYHMWYSGLDADGDNRICHATSPDGIAWTKDSANPVMDLGAPGSLDSNELIHPFVIYEAPLFRMWYNGHDTSAQRILYAVSLDGVVWARSSSPALDRGAPGEWDDDTLVMMCVLPFDGSYYMWYTAINQNQQFQIGYATSPDGIDWTKRTPSEPVLGQGDAGAWDAAGVLAPVVLATGTGLVMWYGGFSSGGDWQTGVATACFPVAAPEADGVQISRTFPNPFSSQTTIQYSLAKPARVVCRIQDAAGRNVRRLIDGRAIPAGPHKVIWNGRDDRGREVPAGVYFYHLDAGTCSETEKLVLIR